MSDKENTVENPVIDLYGKLKLGLLALLISFCIIYPIYRYVLNKSVTDNGLETNSFVVDKKKLRNVKTAGYSYFLTLKYMQDDGLVQETEIGVNKEIYLFYRKGDSIPIMYDTGYSKNIKLNQK